MTAAEAHVVAHWPELAFVGLFALAVAADLWLVFTGRKSISLRTWLATEAHPTLIAAGMLASVGVAWLLRDSATALFVWGILSGHLLVHD